MNKNVCNCFSLYECFLPRHWDVKKYFRNDNCITSPVFSFFRNIKTGLVNLWKWKSVVWNDRDFDYYNLYVILQFKLKQMHKRFEKDDVYVNQGKDAKRIKICCLLLDRLTNEFFYHENACKNHDKKWGKLNVDFVPCEDRPNFSRMKTTRENIKTVKDEKQENKEFLRCIEHEEYLKKQDLGLLCKMLNKYSRTWWI